MNVFDRGFYDSGELKEMGFKSVGINVSVSKMCSILGVKIFLLETTVVSTISLL